MNFSGGSFSRPRCGRHRAARIAVALLLIGGPAGAALLAGCGGGGGGGVPGSGEPPVVMSRSFAEAAAAGFEPSYRGQLDTLRQWPKRRLRVFVRAVGDGRDRVLPMRQAISLWEQATQGFVSFELVGIEEQADVVVNFVEPARLSEGAVGYTTVTYQVPGNTITHAEVFVNKEYEDSILTQISAHELGHSLGVDGHSTSELDLMFPRVRMPARVSLSDANTVFWNYQGVSADGRATRAAATGEHQHTVTCGGAGH